MELLDVFDAHWEEVIKMPERDWERDWEICKKATSGPWVSVNELEFDGAIEAPNSKLCIAQGVRANDKAFIAEARTGWPAALEERARLEKRVKELEKVLIEVYCICRQRAPKNTRLLTEVKQVIRTASGWKNIESFKETAKEEQTG